MRWIGALVLVPLVACVVACAGAASPSPAGSRIEGIVTAGPVCPVERPGDPACAPRPIAGALVMVRTANGEEVGRATTDSGGRYRIDVPAGHYTVEGTPVEGLMGNPAPVEVDVGADVVTVNLEYDTGIR